MTININAINELVSDPDFEKLKTLNQNFNSFDLNIPLEMNHSNMISWLLNPRETHGLGNRVFIALLNACWQAAEKSHDTINPTDFVRYNFSSALILTEYDLKDDHGKHFGRLDIFIALPDDNVAILIENKTGIKPSEDQLNKYKQWSDSVFEKTGTKVLHVYMDAFLKEAVDDNGWVSICYEWLSVVLQEVIEKNEGQNQNRSFYLMKDYYDYWFLDHLERDDFKRLNNVLKRINHDHSVALKSISSEWDHSYPVKQLGADRTSDQYKVRQLILENECAFEYLMGVKGQAHFANQIENDFKRDGVNIEIEYTDKNIDFYLPSARNLMEDDAEKWGLYFNLKSLPEDSSEKYKLRLFLVFKSIKDSEENLATIAGLWKKITNKDLKKFSGYTSYTLEMIMEDNHQAIIDKMLKHALVVDDFLKKI